MRISLKKPDFTTAARIEKSLNEGLGGVYAKALDSSTIDLIVPPSYEGKIVQLVAIIENYRVIFDAKAKIVINERTGTIVATQSVRISPVAVSSSNVTIFLNPTTGVSQPLPFSQGATTILQGENADLIEEVGRFEALDELDPPGASTVNELASALNKLGLTTREMTSILQSIKNAGALQAELIIN